jgi:hypothetical protein
VAALRTAAEAAEQPLFVAGVVLIEGVADQIAGRRRLGIQAEDRRVAARALGL